MQCMLSRQKKVILLKKSQIAGQILIYVLAIIVFSLTLLYGYKAVKYFTERSTEISYRQLENKISNDIEKVEGDTMGTVKRTTLTIPGNHREVCLFDSVGRGFREPLTNPKYELISDSLSSTENNMFLYPSGTINFDVGDIKVILPNCINITGSKVTLRLESMGDHVKVSEWGK